MPNVFVINQPTANRSPTGHTYNINPATKYGDIMFIFRGDEPPPSRNPEEAIKKARTILSVMTKDDFLLWAGGDPMGSAIAISVATQYLNGKIKWLAWNKGDKVTGKSGFYSPIQLDTTGANLD